jgi:hypothetical protein
MRQPHKIESYTLYKTVKNIMERNNNENQSYL